MWSYLPQEWNILHRPTALGLWWRSSKTWSSSLRVPWRFSPSGRWQGMTCFVITLVDIQSNDRKTRCTKNFMLEDYSLCFPYLFINQINHFLGMFFYLQRDNFARAFQLPTRLWYQPLQVVYRSLEPVCIYESPMYQPISVLALNLTTHHLPQRHQSKLPALFIATSAEVTAGF